MFLLEYEYIYEDSLGQSEETMSWTCDRLVEPFFPPSYCTLDNTSLLRSVKDYFVTETLKELTLTGCGIQQIACLPDFPNITTLNLSYNHLTSLKGLQVFLNVTNIDLSFNNIQSVDTMMVVCQRSLNKVEWLDLSDNYLSDLSFLEGCTLLEELRLTHNVLEHLPDCIHQLTHLVKLDLSRNYLTTLAPLGASELPALRYVGSYSVQESDVAEAIEIFSGCLDKDYLLRQHSASDLQTLTELTLVHCSIKKVWLPGNVLPNLYSVNLSYNMLTYMWGMHTLPTLHTLCLAHNEVCAQWMAEEELKKEEGEYYPRLQVLYLNNNKITTMKRLQLAALPALETLFLQDNQLKSLTGLKGATTLSRLVLDRNRIEFVTQEDFDGLEKLRELYLEGNKLKELFFIQGLNKLDRLFLAYNRIMDINEVSFLATLNNLKEVTLLGNPLCRKVNYYQIILKHMATIELLDGHRINLNK